MITRKFVAEIELKRNEVASFDRYPFSLPAVRSLETMEFEPYLTATTKPIRGEQANLRAAIRLGRLQAESNTSRKAVAAKRPATTRSPRNAWSKGHRPTRS